MNLKQANLNNLTALWELGGRSAGKYYSNEQYSISLVSNAEWPNKLWFLKEPNKETIQHILSKWDNLKITIAIWGKKSKETMAILKTLGFEEKNRLAGMSLKLNREFEQNKRLSIKQVRDSNTADQWTQLFHAAFGYQIHPKTVELTMHKAVYLFGEYNDQNIGTAVLYIDEQGFAGIHSMGIIPEYRRKGFAEELLIHLLNLAKSSGAQYATLQASDMGKGLYQKIGFQEDFRMINFIKTKNRER